MSTTSGKNNFNKESVRNAAKYKLWILYNPRGTEKFNRKKGVLYSYNNKPNFGLDRLRKEAEKKKPFADLIRLYNNITGVEMETLHQSKTKASKNTGNHQQQPKPRKSNRLKRPRVYRKSNRYYI